MADGVIIHWGNCARNLILRPERCHFGEIIRPMRGNRYKKHLHVSCWRDCCFLCARTWLRGSPLLFRFSISLHFKVVCFPSICIHFLFLTYCIVLYSFHFFRAHVVEGKSVRKRRNEMPRMRRKRRSEWPRNKMTAKRSKMRGGATILVHILYYRVDTVKPTSPVVEQPTFHLQRGGQNRGKTRQ